MRGNSRFSHNYSWIGVQGIKNNYNDNKKEEGCSLHKFHLYSHLLSFGCVKVLRLRVMAKQKQNISDLLNVHKKIYTFTCFVLFSCLLSLVVLTPHFLTGTRLTDLVMNFY